MISPESLRQYSYFAQLNEEQLECLVESSTDLTLDPGSFLFHIDSNLVFFYLVEEGEFEVVFESPKLDTTSGAYGAPSQIQQEIVVMSRVGPGEILGWSGLVQPFKATSGVRAKTRAKVWAFDCKKLLERFETDCNFGYIMLHTAALVIGKRLQDIYKGGGS